MRRVLIVEDEESLAEMLCELLQEEGLEVELVRNGIDALAAARRSQPDLILLDWMLPLADGSYVIDGLAADGADIPVVVMTSVDAAALRGRRHLALLHKPFNLRQLLDALEKGLSQKKAEG